MRFGGHAGHCHVDVSEDGVFLIEEVLGGKCVGLKVRVVS